MLKYRKTTVEDIPKLNAWVRADPAHRDQFTGSHFVLMPDLEHGGMPKGKQCIEVQDEDGTIFYLKFTNAILVEAQFSDTVESDRIRKGLKEAFGYFSHSLKELGYHAMLFDSVSESLIKFFEKVGFKRLTDFFRVQI